MHLTLVGGTLNRWANWPAVATVACVEAHTVSPPSLSHSATMPCDSRHWWQTAGAP